MGEKHGRGTDSVIRLRLQELRNRLASLLSSMNTLNTSVSGLATELTLQQVLIAIQDGTDFEARVVVDDNGNGTTYLEIRLWNTVDKTWEDPLYYLPGSNTGVLAGSLTAPIKYINNSSILAQIYAELQSQGVTLDAILVDIGDILSSIHLEVDDDAIDTNQELPTNINLLYGAYDGEGYEWRRIQIDNQGQLKGIQQILNALQTTLDVNVTNATLAVTQSGAWTVTSNQGTSPWVVSGTVALDAATLAALETITVNQGTSPWTVDGTVNAAQSGVWTVALDAATLAALETITVEQGTSPWVVSSVDLDIRDLTFATDKVDASGSDVNSRTQDGSGTGITSTVVGLDTGLDVNVIGGAVLDVNLDQNNDQVQVYGSDLTAPIATDTAGHVQVDILTIPEVEVKNDVGNPIPISDAGGSITVDGTVAATQSGTWDINNISGIVSLPTGAATEATLLTIDADTGNIATNTTSINTALTPATRTHNTVSATGAGSISAGSICGSVINAGSAAGTWNGISLPAGISIPWAQIGNRDTYGVINYDATGTTFIIEYTT